MYLNLRNVIGIPYKKSNEQIQFGLDILTNIFSFVTFHKRIPKVRDDLSWPVTTFEVPVCNYKTSTNPDVYHIFDEPATFLLKLKDKKLN